MPKATRVAFHLLSTPYVTKATAAEAAMPLSSFTERQLHNANYWCFKCDRYGERKCIRENQVSTEHPRLSEQNK